MRYETLTGGLFWMANEADECSESYSWYTDVGTRYCGFFGVV